MPHVINTEFELQRRGVLLKANTNMTDHSPLGFEAEPSTAVLGNSDGEDLIVNCPAGSQYMQADGTKWDKMSVGPAVWQKAGSGGGGSTTLALTPDLILADGTGVLVTPQTDGVLSPRYFSPDQSHGQNGEVVYRKFVTHILSGAATDSVAVEAYMDKIVGFYLYSVGPANNFVLTDGANGGRVTDINQNLITATVSLEQLGANIAINGRELKGWIDYTLGDHVNADHLALPTTVSAGNVMIERDKVNLNPQLVLADGTDLLADIVGGTRYFAPDQSKGFGEVVYRKYYSVNVAAAAASVPSEPYMDRLSDYHVSGRSGAHIFVQSANVDNREWSMALIDFATVTSNVSINNIENGLPAGAVMEGWIDYTLLASEATADHQPLPTTVGASNVLVERNVVDLENRLVLADGTDSLVVVTVGPRYFSPEQVEGLGSVVYRVYYDQANPTNGPNILAADQGILRLVSGNLKARIPNNDIINTGVAVQGYSALLGGRSSDAANISSNTEGNTIVGANCFLFGWVDYILDIALPTGTGAGQADHRALPATVNATTPVVNNVVNYITQLARESDSVAESPVVQVAYFSPNQMDGLGDVVYRIYIDVVNDQSAFMTLISFPNMNHIINSHLTVFTTAINGEVIDFGGTTNRGIEINLQSAGTAGASINLNSRAENLTSNIYKGWFDFTVSAGGNPLPT